MVASLKELDLTGAAPDQHRTEQQATGVLQRLELVTMYVSVLRAQRRALPLEDYNLAVPLNELIARVCSIGQGVQTAEDLKEAKI